MSEVDKHWTSPSESSDIIIINMGECYLFVPIYSMEDFALYCISNPISIHISIQELFLY